MNLQFVCDQIDIMVKGWEQECIRRGHSIHNKTSAVDNRRWRLPPLMCGTSPTLDQLLKDFYFMPSGEGEVLSAWDNSMNLLLERARGYPIGTMNKEFNQVFPEMTFGGASYHPLVNALQFLLIASWQEGRSLDLKRQRCLLSIGSTKIGLDRTALYLSNGGRRTRMTISDCRSPMKCQRGGLGRKPALPKTNGAYRLLARTLPHRVTEMEIVFALAVQLGSDVEHLIVDRFDIVVDHEVKLQPDGDPLLDAKQLVETSVSNPIRQLAKILVPVYGADKFIKHFGSPYQKASPNYSMKLQHRHRSAIESLINGEVCEKEIEKKSGADLMLNHFFGI